MNALTGYVIAAAVVLALAALASWRRWGSKRFPLIVYVIAVAVVWAVLLGGHVVFGRYRTLPDIRFGMFRLRARDARHVYCRACL
jgi:hypothetical protein